MTDLAERVLTLIYIQDCHVSNIAWGKRLDFYWASSITTGR